MSFKPDNTFLKRLKAGQQAALEELYLAYRVKFVKVLLGKYSCKKEDALEIYQIAIVIIREKILEGELETLNNENSLWNYLFSIGRNTYYDLLRKQKKIAEFPEEYFGAEDAEEATDRVAEDDLHFDNLSLMEIALKNLGNPCSEILELFYYEDKSMKEIADELDYKNYDTAKNLKYKCLQRLKKAFVKISKNNR